MTTRPAPDRRGQPLPGDGEYERRTRDRHMRPDLRGHGERNTLREGPDIVSATLVGHPVPRRPLHPHVVETIAVVVEIMVAQRRRQQANDAQARS